MQVATCTDSQLPMAFTNVSTNFRGIQILYTYIYKERGVGAIFDLKVPSTRQYRPIPPHSSISGNDQFFPA
jgi:hypothetical protein